MTTTPGITGWLDPPRSEMHACRNEQPRPTNDDYGRRWRCSCGQLWKVADSQRDGLYFTQSPG